MEEIYRARILDALKHTVHELYYLQRRQIGFTTNLCVLPEDIEELHAIVENCGLRPTEWWIGWQNKKFVVNFRVKETEP